MSGNFIDNNCRVVPTRITVAATYSDVLVATGYTQVIGVRLCDGAGVSRTAHLVFYPLAGGSFVLQYGAPVNAGASLWIPTEGFALKEGDRLAVWSSSASILDVLVTIAEVPGRTS